MKVALGSIEVSDEQALALGPVGKRGGRKPASREQVKAFALQVIADALNNHVRIDKEESATDAEPEGD